MFQPRWSLKTWPWPAGKVLDHPHTYLQGRPLLTGPLAGALSLQPQLDKQFQKVHEQLIHKMLILDIGRDVGQGIDHRQGAVPGGEGTITGITRQGPSTAGERQADSIQLHHPLSVPENKGAFQR